MSKKLLNIAYNGMGINEGCSSKSIVSCEDRNKLNRTAYGGSSQATFVLYLVMCRFSSQILIKMNKMINQDGETIICVGQEGSHIRNKEVYNKTMSRLLCRIRSVWSYGGIDRHCNPQDLWDIMEADDIPKDKWKSLYNSAYYYFDAERGVR